MKYRFIKSMKLIFCILLVNNFTCVPLYASDSGDNNPLDLPPDVRKQADVSIQEQQNAVILVAVDEMKKFLQEAKKYTSDPSTKDNKQPEKASSRPQASAGHSRN